MGLWMMVVSKKVTGGCLPAHVGFRIVVVGQGEYLFDKYVKKQSRNECFEIETKFPSFEKLAFAQNSTDFIP